MTELLALAVRVRVGTDGAVEAVRLPWIGWQSIRITADWGTDAAGLPAVLAPRWFRGQLASGDWVELHHEPATDRWQIVRRYD